MVIQVNSVFAPRKQAHTQMSQGRTNLWDLSLVCTFFTIYTFCTILHTPSLSLCHNFVTSTNLLWHAATSRKHPLLPICGGRTLGTWGDFGFLADRRSPLWSLSTLGRWCGVLQHILDGLVVYCNIYARRDSAHWKIACITSCLVGCAGGVLTLSGDMWRTAAKGISVCTNIQEAFIQIHKIALTQIHKHVLYTHIHTRFT